MDKQSNIGPKLVVGLVLMLVLAAAFYVVWPQVQPRTTLRIGDGVFTAQVAATETDRQAGLSGTSQLGADKAMIFVFDSDDKWPIWMKDMNYPLDIVWLNQQKQVVYIVKNAQPGSYPKTYKPTKLARYVIELAAGSADSKTIRVGGAAVFDENNLDGSRQ